MAAPAQPVLPDYGGACLTNVVAAVTAPLRGTAAPPWAPAALAGASQVVLLVLDGLGARQLAERAGTAPTLAGVTGPDAAVATSVAPSTTAAALTSLTTGLAPAAHGVLGYRLAQGGRILNVLHWRLDGADARTTLPPRAFQPHPPFPGLGAPVPVVSRADYAATGFSALHLGAAELVGCVTPSGLAVEVRRLLRSGRPFVYAYYDGIDRVAHARGLGEHYEAELAAADRLVTELLDALPPGAALAVTADHGQVDVGPAIVVPGHDVMAGVTFISGEGRFRWLHVRSGAADDTAAAAREAFGDLAWVLSRDEVIGRGWLGGEPTPPAAERLGDVALVPFAPVAFLDPADTGEQRLAARHGSLTPAEMEVPLLGWRA